MVPESAYRTPGELIRRAREARGLSLEDLAAETRIPDRLLEAMERDEFDQLSGTLYARSFLRNCAPVLGLESATLLDAYERLLTERDPDVPADQTWETETEVQRVGSVPWRGIGMAAGGLVLLVLLVWGGIAIFAGGGGDRPAQATEPEATPSAADSIAVRAEALAVEMPPVEKTNVEETKAEETKAVAEPTPEPTRESSARPRADADDGPVLSPDADALAAAAALPAGDASLVFADGETWPLVLRVILDARVDLAVGSDGDREARPVAWPDPPVYGVPDEGVVSGRLYTVGTRRVAYWGAADHFLLKLSDAEGVTISLNDRPLDIPARIVGREWVLDRTRLAD